MGGLVQFDGSTSLYIDFLGFIPIMEGQLHCLVRLLRYFGNLKHNRQKDCSDRKIGTICAEVRTSRIHLRMFQLESLILAQNERWRQA